MLARRGDPFRSLGCRFSLNRSQNHGIRDTLLFNVLAMVAEFEGGLFRARTREGMKVARPRGGAVAGTAAEAEFGTAEEYAKQFPKRKRRT